jgi:predicted nucleotide-binding protein
VLAGVNVLDSLVERLVLMAEPSSSTRHNLPAASDSRRVFIVHGRDEGLRDQVARVLMRLGFDPQILAEEPWQGRTVIEKFEDKSLEVGFAVVILSPDDYGRGPDDDDWPTAPNRARQNVILELGYFMGAIGRDRVAALYDPAVERPSDIHGVGWIALGDSAWPFKLGAELAAAGFDVDLNQLR